MTLLVTGGAGFIGSNFVLDWFATPQTQGEEVVTLDALTYAGNPENLAALQGDARHTLVQGDICDRALVDRLLSQHRPRAIVHFAAESHVDRSIHGPGAFIRTNVEGTFTLLEAARTYWGGLEADAKAAFRFHHVSTDEVYGSLGAGDAAFTEIHPYEPNSPYSASKAASDHLVRAWHHTYGLPVLTTNWSNNYGPYHFPEKVIPLFVTNLIDDQHVPLYGEGNNIRDWLHVDDHTRGIAMVLVRGRAGEIYNIGGGTELTNKELTQLLLEATGKDWSSVDRVQDRLGHDLRYSVDISKIRGELGYEPLVPFEQGLTDVVQWYRDNRAWWEPLKARAAL